MKIGNKDFTEDGKTYIMGILNVTPDSFSDGGKYTDLEAARAHVAQMIEDGAAIIDVGGESTRPGAEPVDEAEEIRRVVPAIRMIKENFDIPVSVDTYHAATAEAAIEAGADMINDVWGLKYDKKMAEVVAKSGVAICLMHNQKDETLTESVEDVTLDLLDCCGMAQKAGIKNDRIILDPGIGFAKSRDLDLRLIKNISRIIDLGYPVLLGASRKRVIGYVTDLPAEERLEGTMAVSVHATMEGVTFLRVHDVKENYRAVCMAEAIRNTEWE